MRQRAVRCASLGVATMGFLLSTAAPAWADSGPDMDWYFSPLPETYMSPRAAAIASLLKLGLLVFATSAVALFALWRLSRSGEDVD